MPPQSMNIDTPIPNTFCYSPPDASLHRKIIDDFCDTTKPSKCEAGGAVCDVLTFQINIFDMSSLNIDLSVLSTATLDLLKKKENILQSLYLNLMGL